MITITDQNSPVPNGATMLIRDKMRRLLTLTDTENSLRRNYRCVPDLTGEMGIFRRGTRYCEAEPTKVHGLVITTYSGWGLLSRPVQQKLSSLFDRGYLPMTPDERIPQTASKPQALGLLMETLPDSEFTPGRGGLLLVDRRVVVVSDEEGREFVLSLKGCGAPDGRYELRQRLMMNGATDDGTIKRPVTTPRGMLFRGPAARESAHWAFMEKQSNTADQAELIRSVFLATFRLHDHEFGMVCRLEPSTQRLGQFWLSEQPNCEVADGIAMRYGEGIGALLSSPTPMIHSSMNLENMLANGGYADGEAVKYLHLQTQVRRFLEHFMQVNESFATLRNKDLHDGVFAHNIHFQRLYWRGLLSSMRNRGCIDASTYGQMQHHINSLSGSTLREKVTSAIWEEYLALQVVKCRQRDQTPVFGASDESMFDTIHLGEHCDKSVRMTDLLEMYEAARSSLKRSMCPIISNHIETTLSEIRQITI